MHVEFVLNRWVLGCLTLIVTTQLYHPVSAEYTREDIVISNSVDEDTALTDDDFADIDSFKEVNISKLLKPEEVAGDPTLRANKFEGDILGHNPNEVLEYITNSNRLGRNAIRSRWQRWRDGRVPYLISSRYGPYSRKVIAKAFNEYKKRTCIRFVPRKREYDYIYISPKDGCYSLVGKVGGRQPVSLDSGCIQVGTIIHELMHVVGFFHEQSRADRDDYIDIVKENILPGARDQFEKYSLRTITHLGVSYDYGSIMHYGPYAFSRRPWSSRGKTIIARKSGGHLMGQRKDFSSKDLKKINKLYQCKSEEIGAKTDTGDEEEEESEELRPRPRPRGHHRCENSGRLCLLRTLLSSCRTDRRLRRDCRASCGLCGASDDDDAEIDVNGFKIIDLDKIGEMLGLNSLIVSSSRRWDRSCRDHSRRCQRWKWKGYCDTRNGYMRDTCPKSCGLCKQESMPTTELNVNTEDVSSTLDCRDINSHCGEWVRSDPNRCQKLKRYMIRHCRESCDAC